MIPILFGIWNYNKEYIIKQHQERLRRDRDNEIIQEMYDLEAKYLKELRRKKKNEKVQADSHQQ